MKKQHDNCSDENIYKLDGRVLLKKAKKSGELPVSAYAEYIKGEVAI
mgnify:CR=1 FL=1